ncbi:glycoside hydrolase superfamily [Hyaloraphidium curvatum]|nr:glycoside hydrolase superfamily [Hyaloraphidium curvatum]
MVRRYRTRRRAGPAPGSAGPAGAGRALLLVGVAAALLLLCLPASAAERPAAAAAGNGTSASPLSPNAPGPTWPGAPFPLPRSLSYIAGYRTFGALKLRNVLAPSGTRTVALWGTIRPTPKRTARRAAERRALAGRDAPSPVIGDGDEAEEDISESFFDAVLGNASEHRLLARQDRFGGLPPLAGPSFNTVNTFNPVPFITGALARANSRIASLVRLPGPASTAQLMVSVLIRRPRSDHTAALFHDESYSLLVPAPGSANDDVQIVATTALGAMRAFATLVQLVAVGPVQAGGRNARAVRCARVTDRPARPWRGLMIDVARTFIPLANLRRTIDAMEVVKMNVLHLHLYDSESFPLRWNGDGGRTWQAGAFRNAAGAALTYSDSDLRALSVYGFQRGVTLIPEAEGPAHVDAIAKANPDIVTCSPNGPDKSGQLNPYHPRLPGFILSLFSWILDSAFPWAPGLHAGGDEVHPWCWSDVFRPAQGPNEWWDGEYRFHLALDYFYSFVTEAVHRRPGRGRKFMAVWEEAVVPPWGLDDDVVVHADVFLRNRTVVQAWTGEESLNYLLGAQWPTLFSLQDHWYLDCGGFRAELFGRGSTDPPPPPGSWCTEGAGSRSMPTMYRAPLPYSPFLLGGEAAIWTELTRAAVLDRVAWPRAAAVAERLWTDPPQAQWPGLVTLARVQALNRWLGAAGVVPWPAGDVMIG